MFQKCSFQVSLNSDDKLDGASPFKTSNTRGIQFGIFQRALRRAAEQFEQGIDWSRRPQLAHNFEICTVRTIVKTATEKRGRDTDPGGGGYSWKFLEGVCRTVLQILTLFQTKNVIFHTRFQTTPLKSIPVFRPGLQTEIMSSLLRLERKQKKFSLIFLFLSYSFGIETINTFIHSRSSFENHTRFQTKMQGKIYTRFQTKNNNNNKNNNNFYCTQSRILQLFTSC